MLSRSEWPGEDDAHDLRVPALDLLEQLGPVHTGHAHVADHHVERARFILQDFQRVGGRFRKLQIPLIAHGPQQPLEPL